MASDDTNVESLITNHQIDETAGEEDTQVPVTELTENVTTSGSTELKPTEVESIVSDRPTLQPHNSSETAIVNDGMEPDNSSQAVIEKERKGDSSEVIEKERKGDSSEVIEKERKEDSSEVIDKKATENIESSAVEITDTTQSSTTPLPEETKQGNEDKKASEPRRRGRRGGRGVMVRKMASLNLPDGVILVKDRRYTGYHCTYCNCVLRSLATVKAHADGKWHKRTLQIRELNGDKKGKATIPSKSARTSAPKPSPKVPLKSSLEDYLSTVNTTIVGLTYIVETQRPDKKPTFQCNLCEISCDTANIKDHINGMKHCLMYLKLVKPTQLAELLAKQLSKAEKNKEIAKLSEELQRENGRGKIVVKAVQEKEATAAKQSGNKPPNRFQTGGAKFSSRSQREGRARNWFFNRPQSAGNKSNKPVARTTNANQRNRNSRGVRRGNAQIPSQQKRKNEGMSPAKKRQLLEREFQARVQYSRDRARNNFFSGRWGMGNQPMNMEFYQNEANFYPEYPNFYPDPYNERRALTRQQYMNESYEQMSQFPEREMYHRESYEDRRSNWSNRDSFAPNMHRNYGNRSSSSMRNAEYSRSSNVQLSALKRLAGLDVTSDEDAGVVINAINSLTNSFMSYKLRDLSGPVQQLLQKSLKGSDLKSLLDVPTRNVGNNDKYGGSSQMNRDWGISQIAKPKNWLF